MTNKKQNIQSLIGRVENLVYCFQDLEDYKKQNLETVLEKGCEELHNVSISLAECHVIDCIERNETVNTTAIAQKLNMTKGGISKITAKLVKKNMIEAYRLANNQKEIYYRLKPLGRTVFTLHEALHEKAEEVFKNAFSAYSQEELEAAGKFLEDMMAAIRTATSEEHDDLGDCRQSVREKK